MDRRILVGSIIAVVILVLVSFTSVVGFQSIKSTNIAETSPLFNIRTNRAIGEESEILTSNYVGRGNTLPFPKRNDRTLIIQKFVDTIRKMDDKTFERFIASVIVSAQKDERLNGINPNEVKEAFYLIRNSEKSITLFNANSDNKRFDYDLNRFLAWTLSGQFCFIKFIFIIIFYSTIGFLFWCYNGASTMGLTACCGPTIIGCPKTIRKLLP